MKKSQESNVVCFTYKTSLLLLHISFSSQPTFNLLPSITVIIYLSPISFL